jgi:hypothetical protein
LANAVRLFFKTSAKAIATIEADKLLTKPFASVGANFGHWTLEFGIYLLFGYCNLGFSTPQCC